MTKQAKTTGGGEAKTLHINKWKDIPLSLISETERIHFDGLRNDTIRQWALDSFYSRGVSFDAKRNIFVKRNR